MNLKTSLQRYRLFLDCASILLKIFNKILIFLNNKFQLTDLLRITHFNIFNIQASTTNIDTHTLYFHYDFFGANATPFTIISYICDMIVGQTPHVSACTKSKQYIRIIQDYE